MPEAQCCSRNWSQIFLGGDLFPFKTRAECGMHEIGARTVGPTNMLARCAWCHFSNSISQGRGSSRWITCSSSTCGVVDMVNPAYYNANISCQFSDAPSCAGNSYQIWFMIGQLFQAQHMNDHQPEHSEPTVPKGTHRHCLDEKIWSGHLGKNVLQVVFPGKLPISHIAFRIYGTLRACPAQPPTQCYV